MIIKLLIDIIYGVFWTLTLPISIPSMPDEVKQVMATALDYITSGIGIVSQFFDLNYLFMLFGLIMIVDVGMLVYKLVMWVLRKIPMLGID